MGEGHGTAWTLPAPTSAGTRPPVSGRGGYRRPRTGPPHPQRGACSRGTHPGPPGDRALRPECRTWSGATTHQIAATWGRHRTALRRQEALGQGPGAGANASHSHGPSTTQPAHSPPLPCWPGRFVHQSTWAKASSLGGEPAHLGSRWPSPRRKGCHSRCTGGRGRPGGRGTARCGGHRSARWSPQGSSRTAGRRRCPGGGSGTPG